MGTNYYLKCSSCGCSRHIGKSSAGWVFSLRVYPEDGILNLKEWEPLLKRMHAIIQDEYGNAVSVEDLMRVIMERKEPLLRDTPQRQNGTWECFAGEFS